MEAFGTNVGWAIALVAVFFVSKTWRSTRAQLAEAQQQTEHARQQAQAAIGQLSLEKDRDEQARQAQDRGQADQVSAWMRKTRVKRALVRRAAGEIRVVNQSTQPVYAFEAYLIAGDRRWARPDRPLDLNRVMLAPAVRGQNASFTVALDQRDIERFDAAQAANLPFGISFTFTDMHGQGWTRQWNGELIKGRDQFTSTAAPASAPTAEADTHRPPTERADTRPLPAHQRPAPMRGRCPLALHRRISVALMAGAASVDRR
ncbi:hypothetical protein [Kineosporia sp. NBRC 101731]|uniref:hypothetical protein n=1 Tax=Kineosporia sp. NBRC 101731 TaxID=3032199 RepID=UPI00255448F9|nr:hypothetical protein [Kineosporia sp. NBRC 101731]